MTERPAPIPFRPLGVLKTLLEGLGHQVTHCYEDLVFIEHNAFLLRMEEKGEEVSLFFNCESESDKRAGIAETLARAGKHSRLTITRLGTYRLTPNATDNTVSLEFRENEM
jgi:hypothetical protein